MKKTVHIVVQNGLVQAVYADKGLDIEVVLYDLDTEDNEEYDKLYDEVEKLHVSTAKVY